jgi:hypothetical protein
MEFATGNGEKYLSPDHSSKLKFDPGNLVDTKDKKTPKRLFERALSNQNDN